MTPNTLDRIVSYFSPTAGARRMHARATLEQIANLGAATGSTYDAASRTRNNKFSANIVKENDVSASELVSLRAQSWGLYRNNSAGRKVVRTMEAKVIGKGMFPESDAVHADGSPHLEFRARAKQLWKDLQTGFDSRGLPGRGGLTMPGLQKMALRSCMLSGDALYKLKPIRRPKQLAAALPVPLQLQLVDVCRLAPDHAIPQHKVRATHSIFRGIELDRDGARVAMWIMNTPDTNGVDRDPTRVPVGQIGHLFAEEDIDQLVGTPWFAAALIRARQTGDLEENVLMQSAVAACVVGTYSKPTGASKLGLNAPASGNGDLTDPDGNTISKLQPGMLVNTGKDGAFDLQTPNMQTSNPEGFVQHLQRGTAAALPGVKGSTITGDYRRSSFSSEKAADNDAWPELDGVQDWFAASFCQPIYESCLRAAVMSGYFSGVVDLIEFQADPGRYSGASWQGPVALSINPKVDAETSAMRVKGGTTSLQRECQKLNIDWRDVLNDVAELYSVAAAKGIPTEVVNNIMGVDTADQLLAAGTDKDEDPNKDPNADLDAEDNEQDDETETNNQRPQNVHA